MTAAVFLDRDGVINRKEPEGRYVTHEEEFELLPGVPGALRSLRDGGFRLIVVTNQRGVARRVMTIGDVERIHRRMQRELAEAGAAVDAIFVCPHAEGECDCRKPRPGLFLQAAARFPDVSFAESAVVGDSVTDLEPGVRLGCRAFLVAAPDRAAGVLAAASDLGIRVEATAATLAELVADGQLGTAAAPAVRAAPQ